MATWRRNSGETFVNEVTRVLSQIERGEAGASERLLPLVYDELRKLAVVRLSREKPGQTLQATALVHEAYLRLVEGDRETLWNSRGHFFAAAAEAMRRLLVEQARRRQAVKHGGELQRVDLERADLPMNSKDKSLVSLDEALERLETLDPQKALVVKYRFFVQMTNEEVAQALEIGVSTAERHWAFARSWLKAEMARIESE